MTLEEDLAEVKAEIAAVKFLLSEGIVGDPNNPNIAIYRDNFTKEELKVKLDKLEKKEEQLQDEKKLLGEERLILLRLQINPQAQAQNQAGKIFLCEY